MAAALMGRATWLENVSCPEKMVLVAILDVADDHGLAYMLIETLMAKSSLSRRAVQNTLVALAEKGLLLKRTRRNRSSIFKIVVDRLPMGRPPASFSEKELSDDHRWDDDRGAPRAPLAGSENARRADENARRADENAPGAPIHPVIHPVEHPTPSIVPHDLDLLGDPIINAMADDAIVDEFVLRWKELAADVERIPGVNRLGDKRRTSLLARVSEYVPGREASEVEALFDRVFATIRGSRFLRGETKSFFATADWVVTPTYFPKLEETGYAQDAGAGPDRIEHADRSHVQAGQEARDVLRARYGKPGSGGGSASGHSGSSAGVD